MLKFLNKCSDEPKLFLPKLTSSDRVEIANPETRPCDTTDYTAYLLDRIDVHLVDEHVKAVVDLIVGSPKGDFFEKTPDLARLYFSCNAGGYCPIAVSAFGYPTTIDNYDREDLLPLGGTDRYLEKE